MSKMNKKIFISSIIVLLAVVATIVVIVCVLPKGDSTSKITAADVTIEFDGSAHKVEATTSKEGSLFYEYVGIDNDYRSALEPTQAGEYDVKISFTPFKSDKVTETKKVKLTITLPYSIDNTGTEISAYVGQQQHVVLPATYKNKAITSLADDTFKGKAITSVKMPDTEFSINPNAFNESGVKKFIIHENTKLLDGQYPNGIELEFYGNPQTIYNDTFGEITGVEELILPESIKTIESDALSKIKARKLSLYSNLPLKNISLSETIKSVKVNSDTTNKLADSFFEDCAGIEKVEIAQGVNTLGAKSFYNCSSLNELIINSAPEAIGENCFNAEFVLKKLAFGLSFNLNELGLKMIETAEVINCETMPLNVFENCTVIKKIILPNNLKSISSYAFSGCSNLSEIVLPERLETIGHYAFQNCTSLAEITLPTSIETILDGAFSGCTQLKSVQLPQGLTRICNSVFGNCDSLESISLPHTIISIESYAFSGCNSLNEIEFSTNLESIGTSAFYGCYGLQEIVLPEKLSAIGSYVFTGCDILTKLTILSTTIPEINDNSFADLPGNCIVYVPNNLLSSYKERFVNVNFVAIA